MRHAIAFGIELYQRHVSPRKGFCCAHNYLHRRGSCSQFAKRVVLRHGVVRFLSLMRLRFSACRKAFLVLSMLSAETNNEKDETRRDREDDGFAKYCAAEAAGNIACCALLSFFS